MDGESLLKCNWRLKDEKLFYFPTFYFYVIAICITYGKQQTASGVANKQAVTYSQILFSFVLCTVVFIHHIRAFENLSNAT